MRACAGDRGCACDQLPDARFRRGSAAHHGGAGVAAVLDMVAGSYVSRNLQCLAEDGRHITIAAQAGRQSEIDMVPVMVRRLVLTGSTLRSRPPAFKARMAEALLHTVWPDVVAGRLKPIIDATFPIAEAAQAHARMDAGEHVGKIVLRLDPRVID
ncbi:zinc-binding dehydrogenase [Paraburkholderia youngii]|nr:zinc-binding dehydrogenase [Paraburkholderia youngii]